MDPVRQAVIKLLLLLFSAMTFATSPGVKMRLSKLGLSYANTLAEASVKANLQTLKIQDQSGEQKHLAWNLKNIQTLSVSGPTSLLSLDPQQNGLTWTLSNFGISLKADWHAKYKQGWVKISDGGRVSVILNDVSLTVTVGFGQKNERPTIFSKSCSCNIGDVHVDFHGGAAIVYNIFKGILEDRIKDVLQSQICTIVNKAVNVDAEQALSQIEVYLEIDNRFLLDYGLMADPIITSNYLETFNKGEVYWKADKQECPLSPDPIPEWSDASSMLYLWFTEYTAKTFAYVAHNHGYLKYNLTKDNLPLNKSGYLDTTSSSMCIGKIIPQIASMYPNSWVELRINSTAVPTVRITKENITADALADVELVVHTPDGKIIDLLTLSVNLSLTSQASIEQERLNVIIIGHSFDVCVSKSEIGTVNERNLKIVLEGILSFVIIPQLNKLGKAGIKLPVSRDVQFINTKLIMLNGVLLVATDVQYRHSLIFLPEMQH